MPGANKPDKHSITEVLYRHPPALHISHTAQQTLHDLGMPGIEKPIRSTEVRLMWNLNANQQSFCSVHNLLVKFPTFIALVLKCHLTH